MINLSELLLLIIAVFTFLNWAQNSGYVHRFKVAYGKYKFKLIRFIKKTV